MAAAALSQQVSHSNLLNAKRPYESEVVESDVSVEVPSKREKVAEVNQKSKIENEEMEAKLAKLAELESKYESLKNNSLKLAAAVMKGKVTNICHRFINYGGKCI